MVVLKIQFYSGPIKITFLRSRTSARYANTERFSEPRVSIYRKPFCCFSSLFLKQKSFKCDLRKMKQKDTKQRNTPVGLSH